jgi:hypothetical protein
VNRALQAYNFLDAETAAGTEILVRPKGSGELTAVRFL